MDSQIPETKIRPSGPLSAELTERILHDYESILAGSAPALGWIADIGELPYSKQLLKDAVTAGMATGTDARRDQLRMAYLALADWQEGVGDQRLELTLLKPVPLDDGQAPGLASGEDMDRWNIKVVDERRALAHELNIMGFYPPY